MEEKNHYIFYQGKCLFTVLNYGYLRMMNTIADEVRTITPTTPPDTKPMVNDASELFAWLKKIQKMCETLNSWKRTVTVYTYELVMRAIASLRFPETWTMTRREAEGHSSRRGKP